MSVNVLLLGPVGVERDGERVCPPSSVSCALLAALGLAEGRSVSGDALAEQVWGSRGESRSKVAVAMHRLRRWLRQETGDRVSIRTDHFGYALELACGTVDLTSFRALVAEAAGLAPAAAVPVLARALGLWRGRALENVPVDRHTKGSGAGLDRERWAVVVRHAQASLRAGDPETAVNALLSAVGDHPTDEVAHAALIEALAASGRQAEAIELYERLRARLADGLGVDPGVELREAHLRVLRQELPAVVRDRRSLPRALDIVPAQLPATVSTFVGRAVHVKQLDELLGAQDGTAAVGVLVIAGSAGIGKTALALHWAHRVRDQFPDGQLFVDLRGFGPTGSPRRPHDVLSGFLRAMGVDAADISSDVEEAAALYRSRLSGRRVLVVLDNASTAADIRDLLPGSPTCAVVVTSRNSLGGLVAHQGARLVELAALSPASSRALLGSAIGREMSAADVTALDGLAGQCANLPLALRLAAAYLTSHPHTAVVDYAEQLANGGRLSVLDNATDERDAISAAFQSSYTALSAAARALFRVLSLVPGHDVGLPAAAALLDTSRGTVRLLLDELCATHLVAEHLPGRYAMHDLLRAYATARSDVEESAAERTTTTRRLVDFYTDTVYEAAPLLRAVRKESPRDLAHPVGEPLRFVDREAALAWHDQERDNVLGTMDLARHHGWHIPVWQMADTLFPYFAYRRRWSEWFTAYQLGLASAEQLGDQEAVASMHIGLGVAYKQTGDYDLARTHYLAALRLAQAMGDDRLTTSCNINLGGLCVNEGDPATGITYLRAALPGAERSGQPHVAGALYVNYGCALLDLDELVEATEVLTKALDTALRTDDAQRACYAHHNLAEVALRRGLLDDARHHAEEELRLARRCGDPVRQAAAFDLLASAVCHSDRPLARSHWTEAHTRYQDLNHRVAEPLAAWLAAFDALAADVLSDADGARRLAIRKLH